MAAKALALKEEGNKHFAVGEFKEAESLYTQAIQKDPSNPKLFTNRAMARLKLQAWEACIDDSIKSIELEDGNMKGYFYLAQAQLALNHPNEAMASALTAYDKCIETLNPSAAAVSALVLKAKKEKWVAKEREDARRKSALLRELEDSIMTNRATQLANLRRQRLEPTEEEELESEMETAARQKTEDLRSIFAIADPANLPKRVSCHVHGMLEHQLTDLSGSSGLSDRRHLFCGHARSSRNSDRQHIRSLNRH